MGTVWMAEQTQPVQRKVALKLIKPGIDSRQIIARFEAEWQALATMDHVNISRVLDAGTTVQGRPHFVMESLRRSARMGENQKLRVASAGHSRGWGSGGACRVISKRRRFRLDLSEFETYLTTDGESVENC